MKTIISMLLFTSLCFGLPTYAESTEIDTSGYQKQAKQKIKIFATRLKSTLQGAIKTGGFENAINVCSETAPQIAASLSTDGWTMGRVSLKARNSANQPDEWEEQVLLSFIEKKSHGAKVPNLVAEIVQETENTSTYRLMKAIPTGGLCLTCHGTSINAELKKVIDQHYPNDQAVGYQLGDIRGAFTLQKKL